MAAKQKLQWLIREVEQLGEKAVIDAQAVLAIKNHYQPQLEKGDNFANKVGVAILAAIGSLLIGGGIILVFAHNWQEFSRAVRAILSLLPVLLAAGLMCFTIIRNKGRSWREASATLMVTASISCFALICQTYYLGGKFTTFMFYVALMISLIPLILPSLAGFILYLTVLITWQFSCFDWWHSGENHLMTGLQLALLLIVPVVYYVLSLWKSAGWEKVFNSWLSAVAASIIICTAIPYFVHDEYCLIIFLASGCVINVLASIFFYAGKRSQLCSIPFVLAGFMMMIIPLILVQIGEVYADIDMEFNTVSMLFALLAFAAAMIGFFKRVWVSSAIALMPGILLILYALEGGHSGYPAIIISAIVALIAIFGIVLAMSRGLLGVLNYSAVLLLSVIVVRFFDGDFSILARAIAFIICGVGLLGLNGITVMIRKKKATHAKEALSC